MSHICIVFGLSRLISLVKRLWPRGIVFRKYKVASRLGACALRRRLLGRLRARTYPAVVQCLEATHIRPEFVQSACTAEARCARREDLGCEYLRRKGAPCSWPARHLRVRDKPRNTRTMRKANRQRVCLPRILRIPRSIPPHFGWSIAARHSSRLGGLPGRGFEN